MLALDRLRDSYENIARQSDKSDFLSKALGYLGISYEVNQEFIDHIPQSGPLIIVANHPFGGVEGMILTVLVEQIRPDNKIMANHLLRCIPELDDRLIYVDPFGHRTSARRNMRPWREMIHWVENGGALTVFPAGEVSHLDWQQRQVTDPEWNGTIARLIRRTRAAVVPVFIDGRGTAFFQIMGLVNRKFRTMLLPRELLNKRGRTIHLRVGSSIPASELSYRTDREMMDYLRLRTYLLKAAAKPVMETVPSRQTPEAGWHKPAAPLPQPLALAAEISRLPEPQILLQSGEIITGYARARQIPLLLEEIGRLREITFRAAGEGTGKELDLDEFDDYYLHLFAWNTRRNELVGAYRLGCSDEILKRYGNRGLYTRTLFRFGKTLLQDLGPALELGRSFIRQDYQKSYSALLLLWKGIGAFIARNPRYRYLFGPVSISGTYLPLSRHLMTEYLRQRHFDFRLARRVKAKAPFLPGKTIRPELRMASRLIGNPDDLSSLISSLEADGKGLPVLLRQYLKLGGKLAGFSTDSAFNNALDGLIFVDLTMTSPPLLERYLGKEGTAAFLQYHSLRDRLPVTDHLTGRAVVRRAWKTGSRRNRPAPEPAAPPAFVPSTQS